MSTLPGFGLSLDYRKNNLFPDVLDANAGYGSMPLTSLREFYMLRFMNTITDKKEWDKKVFDDEIAHKWKTEAIQADWDFTQAMADWCIEELRYKAKVFEETAMITVYNGDVVKSDTIVPDELRAALKAAVEPLEDVPGRQKDWHPGSNEQVLDLVHPSLFPLIYGRSRILSEGLTNLDNCIKKCGEGQVIDNIPTEVKAPSFSKKFQWLPCEVNISQDIAKIGSYINNLHPYKYKELYNVIEQVIDRAIPLWNKTLTPLKPGNDYFKRIEYSACEYDPDPENGPEDEGPQQEEDEDEDDFYERREEWYRATRVILQPEPETFKPPNPKLTRDGLVDLRKEYKDQGLQVIAKLANIELTPEKPNYPGGTWHLEGQSNEHICATALYYYSSENTTTSRLAFRQRFSPDELHDIGYEQEHHDWLSAVFGCQQYGPCIQDVGSIDTKEGRLLTFSNCLQHQVQPFQLADPTKPGHRKILALFLVDPHMKIISTAHVPCQQKDWWWEEVTGPAGQRLASLSGGGSTLADLPVELQDHVVKGVEDFPIGLEDAKAIRLQLMEERKDHVIRDGKEFESSTISLCEH